MTNQRKLLIALAGGFGLLVVISLMLWLMQSRMGKVFTVTYPTAATVKIDGKEVPANGSTFVSPGKHELVATHAVFDESRQTFEIASGENKKIESYLQPNGDGGAAWLKDHPADQSALDGHFSKLYEQSTAKAFSENSILSQLPIIDPQFRIDQGISQRKDGKGTFALYIQATEQAGRDAALGALRYLGYDPAKFEIIYVDPNTQDTQPH